MIGALATILYTVPMMIASDAAWLAEAILFSFGPLFRVFARMAVAYARILIPGTHDVEWIACIRETTIVDIPYIENIDYAECLSPCDFLFDYDYCAFVPNRFKSTPSDWRAAYYQFLLLRLTLWCLLAFLLWIGWRGYRVRREQALRDKKAPKSARSKQA